MSDAGAIAIIGMAGRFPGASDVETFWGNLVRGVESIERVPHDAADDAGTLGARFVSSVGKVADVDMFDAEFFRVPPAEAVVLDPQHRVLLEVAASAVQDAGYHDVWDEEVGVFVGCGENYYLRDFVEPHERAAVGGGADRPSAGGTDARILSANEKDFLAARIAFKLGFTGPSITVQATCATGLSAVAIACSALLAGDCDVAVAGGVSLLMPDMNGYGYTPGGIFSADGRCRTFDAEATGTVPGSGAAVVVLRRDADARARRDHRRAVIRGWALNNDGGSRAGFTAPNAAGQRSVIRRAQDKAGVVPDDIGYVETHGTATPIGDAVEIEALRRVFDSDTREPNTLVLGTLKPNIGHADAAAGVAGLIKTALVVERGVLPPTLHFRSGGPELELTGSPFRIVTEAEPWVERPRVAGVSAFGLGGNNAHVVVAGVPPTEPGATRRTQHVIALSARTEAELLRQRAELADWVEHQGVSLTPPRLADISFTLTIGRAEMEYRWARAVVDGPTLVAGLRSSDLPAHRVLRWSIVVEGGFREHAAQARRRIDADPLLRAALDKIGLRDDFGARSEVAIAALSIVAGVRALIGLGLGVGRIHAPVWARPVVDWLCSTQDPATIEQALAACSESTETTTGRAGSESAIVLDPDHDLARILARAWAGGATIDWPRYFSGEPRGRVPLPTYPFRRRRHWLNRVVSPDGPDRAPALATAVLDLNGGDVATAVAQIWASVLGLDAIDPGAHFIDDLAGDSMYAVEIGARIGEVFHVDIPVDLPFVAPTVASAADFVTQALADKVNDRDLGHA